jgi:glycosyltransferase family protein
MNNISIKFQKKNKILKKRLIEIASSCEENILVCVPNIFLRKHEFKNHFEKPGGNWWRRHLFFLRGFWYKRFRRQFYGDSNISRFYLESKKKEEVPLIVEKFKQIWQNKNIVFVEGQKSRLGIGNDLFSGAKSIRRVLCPPSNAFDKYDEIKKTLLGLISKDDLIICALGPTATVLCYDLGIAGCQALDLGHIDIEYEWFLSGAKEKESVKGKEVSEVGSAASDNIENEDYKSQIIAEIY